MRARMFSWTCVPRLRHPAPERLCKRTLERFSVFSPIMVYVRMFAYKHTLLTLTSTGCLSARLPPTTLATASLLLTLTRNLRDV